MSGQLAIVSTPIGNLEDLTLRAVRVLREATLIACEDTRHTRKLLEHLGITTRMVSYHEHNETERAGEIVGAILEGARVALVTDAGTPLLSDPGYRVVRAAIDAGLSVEVVPGPSALLTAIAGSGIGCSSFYFGGFLPAKRTQRDRLLDEFRHLDTALVFYEAPHRVIETLTAIATAMPNRNVCAARELTKLHEEWLRGSANDIANTLAARDTVRGEFTLVLSRAESPVPGSAGRSVDEAIAEAQAAGLSRMDAMKQVARARGLSKRELYQMLESAKHGGPPE
ncbi:MAG: 16S rRNA (cytidine(1402)-2'-O)-methyltransferase [Bryobacterales bacterium]|nr:16S rRNA (cytidine(1402)-2'-O)-methyltransferase [Bryobacterales bacterium]